MTREDMRDEVERILRKARHVDEDADAESMCYTLFACVDETLVVLREVLKQLPPESRNA